MSSSAIWKGCWLATPGTSLGMTLTYCKPVSYKILASSVTMTSGTSALLDPPPQADSPSIIVMLSATIPLYFTSPRINYSSFNSVAYRFSDDCFRLWVLCTAVLVPTAADRTPQTTLCIPAQQSAFRYQPAVPATKLHGQHACLRRFCQLPAPPQLPLNRRR